MVDCLRDQQDPTGSYPGDSPVASAGPANNPTMIPLIPVNKTTDQFYQMKMVRGKGR